MPPAVVTPIQDDIYTAVKAFLLAILPLDNDHVVKGVGNRAATPSGPFVVMTAILNHRLRTNQDTWDETTNDPVEITSEQGVQLTMQIDVYGPDSFDWASIITTLWRDDYGCQALAPNCQPLYTDDPRQVQLVDGEQQYEQRWLITAQLQYNPIVSTPQDFAATLSADLINVDVEYPPS